MGYLSGLDWSGDVGDPRRTHGCNPLLVFVVAHIDEDELPHLVADMAGLRSTLGRSASTPFKHFSSRANAEAAFFALLQSHPVHAHALLVDKTALGPPKGRTWGKDRIRDGVVSVVMGCEERYIARQALMIDLPRDDQKTLTDLSTAIRRAQRGAERKTVGKVRPCPDDGADGDLIQVADMIAGEIREHGGVVGPCLQPIAHRINLV